MSIKEKELKIKETELDNKMSSSPVDSLFDKTTEDIIDGLLNDTNGDEELALKRINSYIDQAGDGLSNKASVTAAKKELEKKVEAKMEAKNSGIYNVLRDYYAEAYDTMFEDEKQYSRKKKSLPPQAAVKMLVSLGINPFWRRDSRYSIGNLDGMLFFPEYNAWMELVNVYPNGTLGMFPLDPSWQRIRSIDWSNEIIIEPEEFKQALTLDINKEKVEKLDKRTWSNEQWVDELEKGEVDKQKLIQKFFNQYGEEYGLTDVDSAKTEEMFYQFLNSLGKNGRMEFVRDVIGTPLDYQNTDGKILKYVDRNNQWVKNMTSGMGVGAIRQRTDMVRHKPGSVDATIVRQKKYSLDDTDWYTINSDASCSLGGEFYVNPSEEQSDDKSQEQEKQKGTSRFARALDKIKQVFSVASEKFKKALNIPSEKINSSDKTSKQRIKLPIKLKDANYDVSVYIYESDGYSMNDIFTVNVPDNMKTKDSFVISPDKLISINDLSTSDQKAIVKYEINYYCDSSEYKPSKEKDNKKSDDDDNKKKTHPADMRVVNRFTTAGQDAVNSRNHDSLTQLLKANNIDVKYASEPIIADGAKWWLEAVDNPNSAFPRFKVVTYVGDEELRQSYTPTQIQDLIKKGESQQKRNKDSDKESTIDEAGSYPKNSLQLGDISSIKHKLTIEKALEVLGIPLEFFYSIKFCDPMGEEWLIKDAGIKNGEIELKLQNVNRRQFSSVPLSTVKDWFYGTNYAGDPLKVAAENQKRLRIANEPNSPEFAQMVNDIMSNPRHFNKLKTPSRPDGDKAKIKKIRDAGAGAITGR